MEELAQRRWDLHSVVFFFLSALAPSHTYAYNALPLTFTPSPCISLSHIGNTHTNSQRKGQRERERERCVCYFCVIWFLSCWVKLPSPWQRRALSQKKKSAGGREGNDKGSLQGRGGCQSRKEVLGAACRALCNGGGGETACIQIPLIIGWQRSWVECMHALMQMFLCLNRTCAHMHTHTHNQHDEACEVKTIHAYAHKKLRKSDRASPVLPLPWQNCRFLYLACFMRSS